MLTPPRRTAATTTLTLALLAHIALLAATYPAPNGRVNDFAHILDETAEQQLVTIVNDVERQTKAELAIVTVTSLDGQSVEEYADGLFKAWGIGKKDADNGLLILVCPDERVMRIEVGYGLEGILPDGLAGQVIRNEFTPAFRDGNYPRGILDGTRRLADIVKANHVLTPDELRQLEIDAQGRPPTWLTTPFLGLFVGLGSLALGAGTRAKSSFMKIWGAGFGGIPLLLSLIPFFNVAHWVLIPMALGLLAFGYIAAGSPRWKKLLDESGSGSGKGSGKGGGRSSGSGRSSGGSSWSSGSSSSSSSSGSSSGSSFGGGSSGGGGASGRW